MSRDMITKEMAVRVHVPRYVCDGCGATHEAGKIDALFREAEGIYRAAPAQDDSPAWNDLDLPGQPTLTLCVRCTAAAVLAARVRSSNGAAQAAALPAQAATEAAETPPEPAETGEPRKKRGKRGEDAAATEGGEAESR